MYGAVVVPCGKAWLPRPARPASAARSHSPYRRTKAPVPAAGPTGMGPDEGAGTTVHRFSAEPFRGVDVPGAICVPIREQAIRGHVRREWASFDRPSARSKRRAVTWGNSTVRPDRIRPPSSPRDDEEVKSRTHRSSHAYRSPSRGPGRSPNQHNAPPQWTGRVRKNLISKGNFGGGGRDRTADLRVMNPPL